VRLAPFETISAAQTRCPGSYEAYVRAILHPAIKPKSEGGLGYRAVVINFRGCRSLLYISCKRVEINPSSGAGVPITSPRLYSAGHTDDTRHALAFIAHKYPNAQLHGVGFSLGSNVLTRYLGEEQDATRIHSACALACVRDPSIPSRTGRLTFIRLSRF
jgi:uncharacterized protein